MSNNPGSDDGKVVRLWPDRKNGAAAADRKESPDPLTQKKAGRREYSEDPEKQPEADRFKSDAEDRKPEDAASAEEGAPAGTEEGVSLPAEPETPPAQEGQPAGRRILHRRAIALAAAALAAILLLCWVFHDSLNLDALRRHISYINVSSSGEYGSYSFSYNASNAFASFDNGLAVATVTGVTVYSEKGTEKQNVSFTMEHPAVQTGGKFLLAWDTGGRELRVIHASRGTVAEVTTDTAILDADIASDGAVCYLSRTSSYKAVLTVLDADQNLVYKWNSSTRYYNTCAVAPGGSMIAAASPSVNEGCSQTTLLFFDTDSEEPAAETVLGEDMILDMRFLSANTLCAIGENTIWLLAKDGTVRGSYDISGCYLQSYTMDGEGFIAICANTYQAGDHFSLITIDSYGREIASCYIGQEVRDLSACGRYLAVLTGTDLTVYDSHLKEYAATSETASAQNVLMRDDGTALLLDNASGHLYIP